MRVDFAAISIPEAPNAGQGRFVPAQLQPGRERSTLPSFGPDFSPRLSVAYDLFGDARTALKFGWNKYVRDVGGNLVASLFVRRASVYETVVTGTTAK